MIETTVETKVEATTGIMDVTVIQITIVMRCAAGIASTMTIYRPVWASGTGFRPALKCN
jgi:hypothetical protein